MPCRPTYLPLRVLPCPAYHVVNMDTPLPATTSTTSGPTTTTTLPSGPAIRSRSDLSCYSSGPSHTSTGNTSPDSAFASALSPHSSPLIDLSEAATSIEHAPDTFLDRSISMDNGSSQSVNDRRNKLANERLAMSQLHHAQQQQRQQLASPQPHVARAGVQAHPGNHRGVASANWRAFAAENANAILAPSSQVMYSPHNAGPSRHSQQLHPHPQQQPSLRATPFPPAPRVDHQHQHQRPQQGLGVTSFPNLGSPISDAQLDDSFAYCYDRGNGQYTRLIPADMLPALQNIPALQQGCVGMVVVPQPRGLPANGRSSNTEPVALRVRNISFFLFFISCAELKEL